MKILINGKPILKSAGIGEYTRNLANGLSAIPECEVSLLFEKEVECSTLDPRIKFLFRKKDIKWNSFDVFHSADHFIPQIPSHSIKKIVTIHDLSNYVFNKFFPFHKRLYKHFVLKVSTSRADKIIADSYHTKKDILKYLKVHESRVSVVHCGIDPVFRTQFSEVSLQKTQTKHSLPNKFILHVGTIEPRKNIISLIKAFEKITDEETHLVLVGKKGWLYTPTYRAIETSSKKEKIHVLDNVDDNRELAKIYQHANLFVYPSFYEGFGLPVIEAMASKTPVITTNVSSLPEVAKDGALYVNPDDIHSLTGLISSSISCPSTDRIDKAFEISQQYTWAKAAAQVLEIYNLKH